MKRLFDLLTAVQALIVLLVPAGLVALAVLLTSKGPVIYWSDRVGRYNKIFKMCIIFNNISIVFFNNITVYVIYFKFHLFNLNHFFVCFK